MIFDGVCITYIECSNYSALNILVILFCFILCDCYPYFGLLVTITISQIAIFEICKCHSDRDLSLTVKNPS